MIWSKPSWPLSTASSAVVTNKKLPALDFRRSSSSAPKVLPLACALPSKAASASRLRMKWRTSSWFLGSSALRVWARKLRSWLRILASPRVVATIRSHDGRRLRRVESRSTIVGHWLRVKASSRASMRRYCVARRIAELCEVDQEWRPQMHRPGQYQRRLKALTILGSSSISAYSSNPAGEYSDYASDEAGRF